MVFHSKQTHLFFLNLTLQPIKAWNILALILPKSVKLSADNIQNDLKLLNIDFLHLWGIESE
jgi:hypothetical protein